KKLLEENAAYLAEEAEKLPSASAAPLNDLSKRNLADAENLNEDDWNRTRKLMRSHQYKNKVQQSY
nr:hypothetical protein [Hyphomicrobiales bacterium]